MPKTQPTMPKLANLPARENMPWLEDNTILFVRAGSQAYGTALPTSDTDYKGIAVAPPEFYFGFMNNFEQAEFRDPHDAVIYDIRKFFKLAADCNPNVLEVLFSHPTDVICSTVPGDMLRQHRHEFLSQRAVYTFSGYAMSQLKRIRGHRAWLLNKPIKAPTRAEYGLPDHTLLPADQLAEVEAAAKKQLDRWNLDLTGMEPSERIRFQTALREYMEELSVYGDDERYLAAMRVVGVSATVAEIAAKERVYHAAQRNWAQYQDWKSKRNPLRAVLEEKYGYDTKHGMHLVRLMRMCKEILVTGEVRVRRPDAEELLGIRQGDWSYEKIVEWAEAADKEVRELAKTTELPKKPNRKRLDELCVSIVRATHGGFARL